jgi:Cupredoxin-like domain
MRPQPAAAPMLDLLETAHRRVPAAALGLGAALALGLGGCGPQDDPTKGDVPPPPLTTGTTPTVPGGDRAVAGSDAGRSQKGKQKDDDDGGGGSGGGGRGGGGGGSGGSSGGGQDQPSAPPVPSVRTTLRLTMRDGDPPQFSTTSLTSRAGRVTIILRNLDDEEHGIAVAGTELKEESKPVGRGKTVSITVDLPAGEYQFYCPVEGHQIDNPDGETGLLSVT